MHISPYNILCVCVFSCTVPYPHNVVDHILYMFALDKPRVICDESKMTVEVNKDSLKGLRENHLRLNDPTCRLETHSNSTHVIAVVPLSGCGTLVEVTELVCLCCFFSFFTCSVRTEHINSYTFCRKMKTTSFSRMKSPPGSTEAQP